MAARCLPVRTAANRNTQHSQQPPPSSPPPPLPLPLPPVTTRKEESGLRLYGGGGSYVLADREPTGEIRIRIIRI
ncbi:hypothetical protein M0804_009404 [Polistes exclamans]|nr:hypothetical protein M0804_009404 [Polistes exclamans]